MTNQRKNVLVGLTVLGALAIMGWMILQFGGSVGTFLGGATYAVHMSTPRANGLSEGAPVQYLGTPVGRVETITLNDDRTGFDVELRINSDTDLPANVTASIRSVNRISGASAVVLEPTGAMPTGSLRAEAGIRTIQAVVSGSDLVPDEVTALAEELRIAVREMRDKGMLDNFNRQVEQVGELARSMQELVGDEALRSDVRESVASMREAAASAERIGRELEEFTGRLQSMQEDASQLITDARDVSATVKRSAEHADEAILSTRENVDALTRELLARLEQMDSVLGDVHVITSAIADGRGTAGKMISDDRLYEGLVLNMRLLEELLGTSNRLLAQWEQEGVSLRLFR